MNIEKTIDYLMGLVDDYRDTDKKCGSFTYNETTAKARATLQNGLREVLQCKSCPVTLDGYSPSGVAVQIHEPLDKPKNGYYDGDDDDEDGTPLLQSVEAVIRRSAEMRELRAGDVVCIVKLEGDVHTIEQHVRLTSVDGYDNDDNETTLTWEFITAEEAKTAKEAKAPPAAVQQGVQPVSGQSRMFGGEWGSCSIEHVAMVLAAPHEWKDYEVRYLYTHPTQQGLDALKLARARIADMLKGDDGQAWKEAEKALPIIDAVIAAQAKQGGV